MCYVTLLAFGDYNEKRIHETTWLAVALVFTLYHETEHNVYEEALGSASSQAPVRDPTTNLQLGMLASAIYCPFFRIPLTALSYMTTAQRTLLTGAVAVSSPMFPYHSRPIPVLRVPHHRASPSTRVLLFNPEGNDHFREISTPLYYPLHSF